ncbi:hypothetical protein MASR2M15_16060 [Anaerolineales bacterium]
MSSTEQFYDEMAGNYHLIFSNWDQSIHRQARILNKIIQAYLPNQDPDQIKILDCACGIGTQAIGLASLSYQVTGSDISSKEIERAREESLKRGLDIHFKTADMRSLEVFEEQFDIIIAMDNSLPHLVEDSDLQQALKSIRSQLKDNGLFIASIRDYDALNGQKPGLTSQRLMESEDGKRITFQLWDWEGDIYSITQFMIIPDGEGWGMRYYSGRYRSYLRKTISDYVKEAGFTSANWLMPEDSAYYQPLLIAKV